MNEHIRKCCDGAGLDSNWKPGFDSIYGQQLEKFAELIVRECIRHFNEDYQRDFDTLWREDLTNSIKNHFGVE
jgi:hypothetical protein